MPAPKTAQLSERSLATRKKFTTSLSDLLCSYPLQEITVKEIVAHAHSTRQTFYRYFKSKEDVLHALLEDLYDECYERIAHSGGTTFEDYLVVYFSFWRERYSRLRAIMQHNPHWLFNEVAYTYNRRFYPKIKGLWHTDALDAHGEQYFQNFIFGGLAHVHATWFAQGCVQSPEDMAHYVAQCWTIYKHSGE
ncbi:TetR/AcrR family transcriptional regulator [Alloscardovia omnicolens]|uniref:TetR/AcrR family transcriptional regulator n=1 Tax=Alloscardovia omnicolens TaxID=419015 RepID=UPI003A7A8266